MLRRLTCTFAVVLLGALAIAGAASAQTVTPTRFDDPPGTGSCPSNCSLRQAILYYVQSGDTLQLAAGTYSLSIVSPILVSAPLNIVGAGARSTFIDGGSTYPGFANNSILQMRDLTIRFTAGGPGQGPALWNESGAIAGLQRVALTGNHVGSGTLQGGAIYNSGQLVVSNSLIAHNYVSGGANPAYAGGIFVAPAGVLQLFNSTIDDNFVQTSGGGSGGAIYLSGGSTATLYGATFGPDNGTLGAGMDGGQIYKAPGSAMTLFATVFAQGYSAGATNCAGSGPVTSLGGNVDATTQCIVSPVVTDHIGVDPQLGPLTDNGGPTDSRVPAAGSPAIAAANATTCDAETIDRTDQRGGARTIDDKCDAGAVQSNSLAQITLTGKLGPAKYPSVPLALTITNNGPDSVLGLSIPGTSCTVGFLASGASTNCATSIAWSGDSVLSQSFAAKGAFNAPSGAQPTLALSALAPRLSRVSLRPPKLRPAKSGATLGTKKVKGAAAIKYTGVDLSGLTVPIQRPVKGNVKNGKCVKIKPGAKAKGRKCALWSTLTTVKIKKAKTSGTIYFTGRVKNKAMKKGKYRMGLTATAKDGGIGSPWYLSFSVK